MTLKDLVSFIENDHNQEKGEIVVVVGGAAAKTDLEQEKLDELLKRLLQDLSVKAASQLAADLTGIKKSRLSTCARVNSILIFLIRYGDDTDSLSSPSVNFA